ncbi:hypothetical protein [Cellulomonas cellasea]|uniref:DUF8129 domain-containing protein n=1 Tax=Cellulomonas cellasea TaxID=43670 RepID=A0A7W4UDA5_9CELL|nr:hypothetical protein [Cellulomonas cellasea]MBB2922049.1 hypothetical protein [Cellulomonas cellasea]
MSDETSAQRDALPIPDYDHLPVTGLGHRIRSLSAEQLGTLLTYEQAHGDRLPVLQVLQARLTELEDGAEPSDGDAAGLAPELAAGGAQGGSAVSPQTQGPTINPPSHGVPTNPAQPR